MRDVTSEYTGRLLVNKRRSKRMTQAELAKKLGVTVTTVNHWERERKRPSLKHVRLLDELFIESKEVLLPLTTQTTNQ